MHVVGLNGEGRRGTHPLDIILPAHKRNYKDLGTGSRACSCIVWDDMRDGGDG